MKIYDRLLEIFKSLSYNLELIYVDNASRDRSVEIFRELTQKDSRVRVVVMSRNFGSPQSSYLAGLQNCTGDAAVLIAGDMEDPPELVPKFLKKWEEGYQVVYGVRAGMRSSYWRNFLATAFYWLLRKIAYIDIPLNAGDFSLIDRQVINEIIRFNERDFYLRGVRAYVGFKQTGVEFIRERRSGGSPSDNLFDHLWWAKTIILNFSFKPLEWVSKLAFLVVAAAFLGIIINLISYLLAPSSPPGIPTIVILILFLGGIQLLGIGIIGEYLAKVFVEIKHRPRYIIKEIIEKK